MTVHAQPEGHGGTLALHVAGSTSVANGGVGAYANPEGRSLLVLRATWYVIVASTGAANIDIGVGASNADNTDIISALAVNGAIAGKVYNGHVMQNGAKTEITAPVVWHSDDYITFKGSADTTGLEAVLFLEYIPLAA